MSVEAQIHSILFQYSKTSVVVIHMQKIRIAMERIGSNAGEWHVLYSKSVPFPLLSREYNVVVRGEQYEGAVHRNRGVAII